MDTIINQTKALMNEEFIELESDELNASEEAAMTLIVKAITTKTIYLKALQTILSKAWNPSKGMKIQQIHVNMFSISFKHEWDRKRILESRPWSIMGSHLVVRDWPTNLPIEDISFDSSPFWIRIFGLPPNQMTKNNSGKIGSKIGKVLDIDFTTDGKISWNKYLRIQVEINITQPLHSGFHRSKEVNSKSWMRLRLGHVQKGCSFQPLKAQH
ncbi:hypothetical protein RJ640_026472 [Escallonia rubra]|uniref:DUF4283 domain-containing protein n=1 Tax=Escallonia rubra TaxID=112253 RepID=A0AA88RBC2_9ASTE|nr:hypothetical protein RJ640_026472 [Escallonia rubra]